MWKSWADQRLPHADEDRNPNGAAHDLQDDHPESSPWIQAQRRRLEEIIRNLHDRVGEARANGWHGEVQGLQVSLEAARNKLASPDRLTRNRVPVTLGTPIIRGERR